MARREALHVFDVVVRPANRNLPRFLAYGGVIFSFDAYGKLKPIVRRLKLIDDGGQGLSDAAFLAIRARAMLVEQMLCAKQIFR